MKIKKEFIPLIENGEKRYEFSFEQPHKVEGFYNVCGKIYKLRQLCRFTNFDLKVQGIKSESAFIEELKGTLFHLLDKLTIKDLKENKCYQRIKENEQLYIYGWFEFVPEELEII